MTTAEIKSHILQLVIETEDTSVLKKVDAYFVSLTQKNKKTEWWDKLTKEQKQEILLGEEELKQGKGIPHTEVRKQVDKLLGKSK
jgi:hypothetical protein